MPKLYFIRHGQTNANVDCVLTGRMETDLTQKGIDDAKKIGESLDANFDYYYCSPLKRTKQTLEAIIGNVDYIVDDRITEVYSGDWQGRFKSELPEKEYTLYKEGLLTPPNGESLDDVDKRIISFLDDMFKKYGDDVNILIVTHNAFMRNLKRLFTDENVVEPKNLETFIVDKNMYGKFIESKRR